MDSLKAPQFVALGQNTSRSAGTLSLIGGIWEWSSVPNDRSPTTLLEPIPAREPHPEGGVEERLQEFGVVEFGQEAGGEVNLARSEPVGGLLRHRNPKGGRRDFIGVPPRGRLRVERTVAEQGFGERL